jgi:hypothetical protein
MIGGNSGGGIKGSKDFWSGLIFIAFGIAFAWVGKDYPMGTTRRMGPGMFPFALAWLLIGLGIAVTGRGLLVAGPPIGRLNVKGLGLITLATLAFGALVQTAGLVPAVVAAVVLSAIASTSVTVGSALAGATILASLCSLVFVIALGLPIKLFGYWFGG